MALVVRDKATTWDVGLTHERLSRNNPSTVVFHLHPDSTHHHIWREAEYDEVQHQTQHPITGLITIEILQQEFLDRDVDFLYPKLSQLLPPSLDQLDPRQREELVLQIIARAYVVLLDYSKYFPTAVNLLMREDHSFTPAAPSAIAALKEGRFKSSSTDTSCTICLEDFPVGSNVTCMPCSHIFHRQCIVEWLKNSHYCPVCRFKMPT
ncbi:hypothetical protein ACB092_11G055300 [Castanea dentata]